MGTVEDLGILDLPPALMGHVKLEAGDGIELTYDYEHNSIIITKTVAPKANPGEITDAIIDSMVFAVTIDYRPRIIHVHNDIFAIVAFVSPGKGVLYTVSIGEGGAVSDVYIDSRDFDSNYARDPTITHIAGSTYAIAYTGQNSDGWLKTVSIQPNGTIGDNILDALEFDEDYTSEPSIVHVAGNTYAIAYRGPDFKGLLRTMYIGTDGVIGDAILDALIFDTTRGYFPTIIKIAPNVFAITYSGPDTYGWLRTIGISDAGIINATPLDTYIFEGVLCDCPAVITITEGIIAIAYQGQNYDGWLKTLAIDDTGAITTPSLDLLEFDASYTIFPSIAHVGENIYAIAYKGPDGDGWLKTVSIEEDGSIGDAVIDSFEFDSGTGDYPDIITAHYNLIAITYRPDNLSGRLITVSVDP